MPVLILVIAALLQRPAPAPARYDLVLKGGHVLDPAADVDRVLDVAIASGRIARVAADIPEAEAKQAVDVRGLYVTPGLIDLHAHHFGYSGAILPDDASLPTGVTTTVDCGGAGWRTFEEFKASVIDRAATRVLSFINIVGHGMRSEWEQDVSDMDPAATAAKMAEHPGLIVGIKTAHYSRPDWIAIERAVEAGRLSGKPVIIDNNILSWTGRDTRTKVLEKMRPGDIHTHTYNDRHLEIVHRGTGKLQPFMVEARKRGVLFDLGHGAGSFLWPVAEAAMREGFPPDTISTDLHSSSILGTESDMPNCISKMMVVGMKLPDAVRRSTMRPAQILRRYPELGTLGEGRVADIAVFELRSGVFAFKDAWLMKRLGSQKLVPVLTLREGRVVYDLDGRSFPVWRRAILPKAPLPVAPALALTQGTSAEKIYDIVLKNGQVLDPASGRSGRLDVAISAGKVVRIAADLPAASARTAVDVGGCLVTPGLIDLDANLDARGSSKGVNPDHHALRSGVTTVVDGGSTGWKNFEAFKAAVLDHARTRVLALLNAASDGVSGGEVDAEATARCARKYPSLIVGIRAPFSQAGDWRGLDAARRAAEIAGLILVADPRAAPRGAFTELLARLRPKDVVSRIFALDTPLVDGGRLRPEVEAARGRGIVFDLGHGFRFEAAAAALERGFRPDTVSTAIDRESILLARSNMTATLSKLLNLGVALRELIERATARPARALGRPELGKLEEGGEADIAVLAVERESGRFAFLDSAHAKLVGGENVRAVLTIRRGQIVWDPDARSRPDWIAAGPYSNYR